MKIAGQIALVTGGASGLGAAVVAHLKAQGAKVASLDLKASDAADHSVIADVTNEGEVQTALSEIKDRLGVPRVLVNCAGIGTAGRVLGRDGVMPQAAFEKVVKVNLFGSFNMIRLAAAEMAELDPLEGGERGVIVSTASVAAYDGQIGQAAYAASKGGIVSMTLPLAREFARIGVRVLVVAPGIFETPLLGTLPEEAQKALGESIPFPQRLGRPSEFADMVGVCITNGYLNGEVIRLDGAVRLAPK